MSRVIITGACGFIGGCLTRRLLDEGVEVAGIDNLSRRGAERNAMELATHGGFSLHRADLSHAGKAFDLFERIGPVDAVFHLAGQVAVTTSYEDRQKDFLDNAALSFNVLESIKRFTPDAYCLYSSTNKVYGHLKTNTPVGMESPLAPYTPYGVSKAVGEMYFTEYGRPEIGLATCCLRQSCIYGHHQYGVEDQGWVAWFAIANALGRPVTIYGDGAQVRDLLFVDDLLDLYLECWRTRFTGVYPLGGGPQRAISVSEGLQMIERIAGKPFAAIRREGERPGDQPYFVADLSWLEATRLSWRPRTTVPDGMAAMMDWIGRNLEGIRATLGG